MNEKEYDEKMAAIKEEHTLKKHAIIERAVSKLFKGRDGKRGVCNA